MKLKLKEMKVENDGMVYDCFIGNHCLAIIKQINCRMFHIYEKGSWLGSKVTLEEAIEFVKNYLTDFINQIAEPEGE